MNNLRAPLLLLAAIAAAVLPSPLFAQDNYGLYLARTEHKDGDVTKTIVQSGGFTELRVPYQEGAATFWLKRLRNADNTSKEVPIDRGNTRFLATRQIGKSSDGFGFPRDEFLTADDSWHYHLVTFKPEDGALRVTNYIDGVQTARSNRLTSIDGEFYLIIGADVRLLSAPSESNQQKRSSDANVLLDDLTLWSNADQSILDRFTSVAEFGMTRFDAADPEIVHYYDYNSSHNSTTYSEDASIQITGSNPASSWYDFELPAGGLPLRDASEVRKSKIEVSITTDYGASLVSPSKGTSIFDYDGTNTTFLDFAAPAFIYLDRYGIELGSSDDPNVATFLPQAFYRARNLGYAVRRGGRTDATGTERFFSQPTTDNIDINWNWQLEYAVFVDSATGSLDGLTNSLGNPIFTEDGTGTLTALGRHWVAAGTTISAAMDGIIFPDGEGEQNNISFRSTGYTIENETVIGGADRYLTLSNGDDTLQANDAGISFGSSKTFTLEFWARRDKSDLDTTGAIVDLEGMWVGFQSDNGIRFGSHTEYAPSFSGEAIDLGTEWRHWAYQFDEASRILNIFIDGVSFYTEKNVDPANWDFSKVEQVWIGAYDNEGSIDHQYGGDVNSLRLWNKFLTAEEIQDAMGTTEFGPTAGLALELPLDGDVITETLTSVSLGTAAGFFNNESLFLLTKPLLPSSYTLEILLEFPLPDSPDGYRIPFSIENSTASEYSAPIAIRANGDLVSFGKILTTVPTSSLQLSDTGFNTTDLSPGMHRFTAVVQGNNITHYVDGKHVGDSSSELSSELHWAGASGQAQSGWIDDVRYWTTARTALEVAGDWNLALTGDEVDLDLYFTFEDNTAKDVSESGNDGTIFFTPSFEERPGIATSVTGTKSAEGSEILFEVVGFTELVADSTTIDTSDPANIWNVVFPYQTISEHHPTSIVTTGDHVIGDWLRLTWNWNRTYRLQLSVNDSDAFGTMPFITIDGTTITGIDNMDNVWVPDLARVTVGTVFRTEDGLMTLDPENGASGQINAFRAITMDSLVDGILDGKITREFTFAAITAPGNMTLTYSPTVYRTEIAIGEGLDASSTLNANAQLVPGLKGSSPVLSIAGPSSVVPPAAADGVVNGNAYVWDTIGQQFLPLVPGEFELAWPDQNDPATTYLIRIDAALPSDVVTLTHLENEDGSRIESAPPYETDYMFPDVAATFPASPSAHYPYLYCSTLERTPPVALDSNPSDRWAFDRTVYAEDSAMITDSATATFRSTAQGRAVMLFSYSPDPNGFATGDANSESYAARVVDCRILSDSLQSEASISPLGGTRSSLRVDASAGLYASSQTSTNNEHYSFGSDRSRTWESWIKLDAEGSDPAVDRIAFQMDNGNPAIDSLVQFGVRAPTHSTNPGGFFFSRQPFDAGTEEMALDLPEVAVDSDWHHWAIVMTADSVTIFRDGNEVGTEEQPPFDFVGLDSGNRHQYGYSPEEPGSWLNGEIDNLRFWETALTIDQIRTHMLSHPAPDADLPLAFSYSFDLPPSGSELLKDTDTGASAEGSLFILNSDGVQADADPALVDQSQDYFPEVATRILSKLDTADLGSGFIVNGISNYNPRIHNRAAAAGEWGPLYPVNWHGLFDTEATSLQVTYYQNPYTALPDADAADPSHLHPDVAWPYVGVTYDTVTFPQVGPHRDSAIYIASRLGSEGVATDGSDQLVFDPAGYSGLTIYHQPDPLAAGYNPNEEHAIIAPSIRTQLTGESEFNLGQDAAFALQNEINNADEASSGYTSEPWVLVEFENLDTGEAEMAAYQVIDERAIAPVYQFEYDASAGDPVSPPYPINRVVGNLVMEENIGGDSMLVTGLSDAYVRTLWNDRNGNAWIVSGDSQFVYRFWYPMREDFWLDGATAGDPVAFLPDNHVWLDADTATPRTIVFDTLWKDTYPVLKRGESLSYPGGENKGDNPLDTGLPGIVGWESAELVYDSRTAEMVFDTLDELDDISARVIRPLDRYTIEFPQEEFELLLNEEGEPLTPAAKTRVHVDGSRWYFLELVGSLQKRFYYDALAKQLVFRGRLNNLEGGDPDLTKTPINLSILEPNVMSSEDLEALTELDTSGSSAWSTAIAQLAYTSRDPLSLTGAASALNSDFTRYFAGIQEGAAPAKNVASLDGSSNWQITEASSSGTFSPLDSLGVGSALVPNPELLAEESTEPIYLTLVESNNEEAAGAVTLHIIRVGEERFRGAIKVVEAQNVFDEKINLRHSADFGGNTTEAYYQWFVRDVADLSSIGLPGDDVAWQLYDEGLGLNQIEFTGRPDVMIADKLFYVRYGEKRELDDLGNDTADANVDDADWRLVDPNSFSDSYSKASDNRVPFQWAGAFNSPQLQADGSKDFLPQLVMGWVKRVLDRVNPYEARFSATFDGDAPAVFSNMIRQAGGPYIGPVALNSDRNSLENVGLIELYETVLARASDLTIGVPGIADSGTNQALLLAATRLAELYDLLGSEAYSDALNPSLPVTDEHGLPVPGENGLATANPFVHAFQNQTSSLLDEELALLRGTDFLKAYPVYNRLFWNYLKGLGEAAYNINYRIVDETMDGIINESDAAVNFPQGHGDAWGHYLSANKMHYALLRHPSFNWEARSELYSLLDNVIPADFLDEKSFARIAGSKARTATSIIDATYRLAYTNDPDGQWQGYTDTVDPARAWGVSEWSKRTGHAAIFDWIVGNAIMPAEADEAEEDLDRLDRAVSRIELGEVAAAAAEIQQTLDRANTGGNPLGFSEEALVFDTDPFYDGVGWERRTHFEQIYDRALAASKNALTALAMASRADLQLHRTTEDTLQLEIEALRQDYDYRSRLIAIYGTPYLGTIGPGQLYEEGYSGPDTLLYMYIDRTDLEQLEPSSSADFNLIVGGLTGLSSKWAAIDSGVIPRIPSDAFNPTNIKKLFREFYLTSSFPSSELSETTEDMFRNVAIKAPLLEVSNFAFQAEEDWGTRGAYGEIQILLNEMLAASHEVDLNVERYDDYVRGLSVVYQRLKHQLSLLEAKIQSRNLTEVTLAELETFNTILETLEGYFEDSATGAWREGLVSATAAPTVSGVFDNDVFSGARFAAQLGGYIESRTYEFAESVNRILKFANSEAIATIERIAENDEKRIEDYNEVLELLSEFALEIKEEALVRNEITGSLQQMEILTRRLASLEAQGQRLQEERAAFNMVLAAKAQGNRYKDMTTRLTRNDALGRYDNAFQNALRYTWLAARAYDYETSLDPGSPGAATTYFDRIVRTRQLGLWDGGEPQTGNGGLAEILAQMNANFGVLRGQLGLNNPQHETGQLSLRREHFRILPASSSATRWKQALSASRVDDLWNVPEFRRYCRPFAARSEGAQPGLVIEFATSINPGENVFGRPLAGGDNAYSSANFATKIAAVGTWFEGYNETALSTTPRVYLIPAGNDMLRVADAPEPTLRSWNIVEQRIPLPYTLNTENLSIPGFIPSIDGIDGSFYEIKRFGDFRAYHSSDGFGIDSSQLTTDSRLIGRSVWNTRWLLIIPGATLSADPEAGLDDLIEGITDIKLFFETYSNPGN